MFSNSLNFIIKNCKKLEIEENKLNPLKKSFSRKEEKCIPAMSWGFIYWREFLISKK